MDNALEILYWIFLAETLGYGSSKIKKVAKIFKSSKDFYESGVSVWRQINLFSEKELVKLNDKYFFEKSKKILSCCLEKEYKTIHYSSTYYPKRLKNIDNPPAILYVDGTLPKVDDEILIGIVGTRKPTKYGENIAFNLGYSLAECKVTVVSGGALGVDSCAQSGAIKAKGKVISVLGCGFDCKYLVANEKLRASTKESGALVSEYPPETKAIPRNFPIRNRIISGLSLGIVVVEAGKKSGALITANMARKQSRDIFAIPGNIDNENSIGPNSLIKNGAKLITSVDDVLKEYGYASSCRTSKMQEEKILKINSFSKESKVQDISEKFHTNFKEDVNSKDILPSISLNFKDLSNVSEDALKIYEALGNTPLNVESIILKTRMSLSQVLRHLTELEILNLVKSLPGGKYKKV